MMSANLRAFLAVIRWAEGTAGEDGYRMMVGGRLFTDFSDHPRQTFSGTFSNGKAWRSSAAGAYQFLVGTWDECRDELKLPDFTPESQDQAAVFLIKRRGALHAVEQGDLKNAIHLCNKEWASLPGAPYGQPTKSYADCERVYRAAGGFLSQLGGTPPQGSAEPSPPPAVPAAPYFPNSESAPGLPEEPMALPVAATVALGVELLKLLPFAQKPKNAAAVEKIGPQLVELAKQAAGPAVANEQAAVEVVTQNKAARDAFVAKAVERWPDIAPEWEAAEKSRRDARQFNTAWDGDRLIFGQFRFVELLSLIFVLIAGAGGYLVLTGEYPAEMKGAVITLVLISGFTGVKEFWLGSSRDSQRKTELMGGKE